MDHPPDYTDVGNTAAPTDPPILIEAVSGVAADLPAPRKPSLDNLPSVTVLVLNFNGLKHLEPCFTSLQQLDYPADRLELVLVDNGSSDGSLAYMREHFPAVRLLDTGENIGFAAGNNYGAARATGQYLAILNNDTRVDRGWLVETVKELARSPEGTVCASALMLDWQGEKIDFQAGALNFHGFGFQPSYGADYREGIRTRDLLFACGGAMLVQTDVFNAVGGFDPDYFAFFEDVDLGWRLWLLGYRVVLAPRAIAYHRHHGTASNIPGHRTHLLYERNALYTIYKNYEAHNLERILPAALLLLGQRAVRFLELGGVNIRGYEVGGPEVEGETENVHRLAVATLLAVDEFRGNLPQFEEKREWLQARRARSDAELFALFGQPGRVHLLNHETDASYAAAHFAALHEFGIEALWQELPKQVLVISPDVLPVGDIPASGSGIRAWALGKGLESRGHKVRITMPKAALAGRETQVPEEYLTGAWTPETLQSQVDEWHPDVVVSCGWPNLTWLPRANVPVALDLAGPHLLERIYQDYLDAETNSLEKLRGIGRADFFSCIGSRQRYYFMAWLAQAGVSMEDIQAGLAAIPYSLSPEQPPHRWPESWNDTPLQFVYGGIFLPWQNPAPALMTVASTLGALGTGNLTIVGGKHPFHAVHTGSYGPLIEQLKALPQVAMSGLLPHDQLVELYTGAHVAIDVMMPNPERELAFPSRTVHYLWCGLPVIHAEFSEVAPYIKEWEAGWVVPHDDNGALAQLVLALSANPEEVRRRGENAQRLARELFSWDVTGADLDAFVRQPYIRSERMARKDKKVEADRGGATAGSGLYVMPGPGRLPEKLRKAQQKRRALPAQLAARSSALVRSLAPMRASRARPEIRGGQPRFLLPELVAGHSHGQRFLSPYDGLSGIRLQIETFGRRNTSRLALHIRTNPGATEDLRTLEVPAYKLAPEGSLVFRFPPIKDSAGTWFYFVADSPDGAPGDTVTLWASTVTGDGPTAPQRYEDGLPASGALVLALEFEGGTR